MKRRLFNILAVLSLLLCIAIVSAWILSYYYEPWAGYSQRQGSFDGSFQARHPRNVRIVSSNGAVWLVQASWVSLSQEKVPKRWHFHLDEKDLHGQHVLKMKDRSLDRHSFLGFELAAYTGILLTNDISMPPFLMYRLLGIPYWFIVLLSAILPAWRFGGWKRRLRRHRRARNLCPTCGYDLRATPQRCPECGTVPAAEAKA